MKYLFLVLVSLICLVSVVSADDPWLNFVPSSINGTAPYTVTFVSISYNDPTAWNWSFKNTAGNNTEVWFNQSKNATITFNYGGNYAIRLNSSNADGFNITPFLVFVNVTGPDAPEVTPTLTTSPTPTSTPTSSSTVVPNSNAIKGSSWIKTSTDGYITLMGLIALAMIVAGLGMAFYALKNSGRVNPNLLMYGLVTFGIGALLVIVILIIAPYIMASIEATF